MYSRSARCHQLLLCINFAMKSESLTILAVKKTNKQADTSTKKKKSEINAMEVIQVVSEE